jgi:hypothetical protein
MNDMYIQEGHTYYGFVVECIEQRHEIISKPSSALSVPGETNSLHNKNDRGYVAKETEQQERGAQRKYLHSFITPCASRWVKTKPGTEL